MRKATEGRLLRKLRMIQVMQSIRLHMMLDWLADLLSLNGPEYNISLRHKRGGGGSRAAGGGYR